MANDNIELIMQLRDMLTSPAEKMAQSLNHIAISSRAGAQALDRIEQKMEQLGKEAKKTKDDVDGLSKSLKAVLSFDVLSIASGLFNALVSPAKIFYNLIKDSFDIIGQNEEVTGSYEALLGSAKKAAEFQKYNQLTAAKYSIVGSRDIDLLGKKVIQGGFKDPHDYAQVVESAILVESKLHGGLAKMNETVELLSHIRVKGLRNLAQLQDLGLGGREDELRAAISKTYGIALKDVNKAIKDGKIQGIGLIHILETMITDGKDFKDALSIDFGYQDLLNKFNGLGKELLSNVHKTEEWKKFVDQLNKTWAAISPGSKAFDVASTAVVKLIGALTGGLTSILDRLNKWLSNPENIRKLEEKIDYYVTEIQEAFKKLEHPGDLLANLKESLIGLASTIGEVFGKAIVIGFKAGLKEVTGLNGNKDFKAVAIDKNINASPIIQQRQETIDQLYQPIDSWIGKIQHWADPVNYEDWQKRVTEGANKAADALDKVGNLGKPGQNGISISIPKLEVTLPNQSLVPTNSNDVTHNFNFGDINVDAGSGSASWSGQPQESSNSKVPSRDARDMGDDVKKTIQRALQNIRAPKDQGR